MVKDVSERFWSKVARAGPGDCWLWTGSKNADGYGTFSLSGKNMKAHQVALMLRGVLVAGRVVRHKCDTPACVNPDHLILGTHADNVRDRDERKRGKWIGRKGEANSGAKLTDEKVLLIRADYAKLPRFPSGRIKQGELAGLAERHGIPYGTLRNIVDQYQWTHI